MTLIATIQGQQIFQNPLDGSVSWLGEMTICADGSVRAYGPKGTKPLDYLGNAGRHGNWWGIVADEYGNPVVQGKGDPCPGYFVSTTAYQHDGYKKTDPRRYLDSEKVLYIVVPGSLIHRIKETVLGCRATIKDTVHQGEIECVAGDIGPGNHLGEASIAAAKAFGVPHNPKDGGCNNRTRFLYRIYPGIPAKGFKLQAA